MGENIKLFLCGDAMTSRGIDQILPYSCDPVLYESYVKNAQDYVNLAKRVHGTIPQPVGFSYIWGDAIASMKEADARIINLETSITKSDHYLNKGINYRMHPKNIPCLSAANIDCCTLTNNHVLDWGQQGLQETLETIENSGIKYVGAGRNSTDANTRCILPIADKGRVLVFSYDLASSGIPYYWKATENKLGVNLLTNIFMKTIHIIRDEIAKYKKYGDLVIASHWGENWGYEIPKIHIELAHNHIDQAGIDIIHGYSSHHIKGVEIYKDKPIIYGEGGASE